VRAKVLAGEITLTHAGASRTYRTGEVFSMEAGCEHAEQCGPVGVTYTVGRKHKPVS
jgi:quercetin dioxygenase-like cupin family protein